MFYILCDQCQLKPPTVLESKYPLLSSVQLSWKMANGLFGETSKEQSLFICEVTQHHLNQYVYELT